jgi:hypothetical protein
VMIDRAPIAPEQYYWQIMPTTGGVRGKLLEAARSVS